MVKYIFLGFNALILFLLRVFSGDGVSISHNLPAKLKPGEEVTVDFVIKKESAVQFAKFQLDLPQGIVASESDSKSGQFTVTSSAVKIIWMQFPSENEVIVKIRLKAESSATGLKTITGKMQYVSGNEKTSLDIGPHELNVSTENPTSDKPRSPDASSSENKDAALNKPDEPAASVQVSRTIVKDPATGNFKVEIKISKENVKGFAKYSDAIPSGLIALNGGGSSGATFKFSDNKASFIWATLPKEDKVSAHYWLKSVGDFSQNPVISGAFSYLENEQAMKVKADDVELPLIQKTEEVASNKNEPTDNVSPVNSNTTVVKQTQPDTPQVQKETRLNQSEVNNTVAAEKIKEQSPSNNSNEQVKNTEQIRKSEEIKKTEIKSEEVSNAARVPDAVIAGLNFHVQIGAFKNPPQTDYFNSRYSITEKISTDMHEGLTKFLLGNFSEYKSSRDYREAVKAKGVDGAFVTAYNAGKRITVQEALMLLNQKWYK